METLDRFWVSASECGILLMSLVFTFIECKEVGAACATAAAAAADDDAADAVAVAAAADADAVSTAASSCG